jgi:hypothetical protein
LLDPDACRGSRRIMMKGVEVYLGKLPIQPTLQRVAG